MPDKSEKPAKNEHTPPDPSMMPGSWTGPASDLSYTATGSWIVLRKNETPVAEMFSVSYVAESDRTKSDPAKSDLERPITFVFNGGPGASSAYLHVGTVGPRRVEFPADGSLPEMPAQLVDNQESWLGFTDLVFIDPVGTGFSRVIESDKKGDDKPKDAADPAEFFALDRDLQSMGEFISRWLSANDRWGSPTFVAGESYGGFRASKMAKVLQQDSGVGLNGTILISPALEFATLVGSDYDVLSWVDRLPTMALAAAFHGRSRLFEPGDDPAEIRTTAEEFATSDYTAFLVRGASMPSDERAAVLDRLADLTGLSPEVVERSHGRIVITTFIRELLRDERKVLGLYDATVTAVDPFPDREPFPGPDPTLAGHGPVFTAGVNRLIRTEIGVESERDYRLLSYEVNAAWKVDGETNPLVSQIGATDDFRFGMSLNPNMKAFISHGHYDLITPYYGSDRIVNLMRLDPSVAERITSHHFDGGHMFYAWESSRVAFRDAIAEFVAASS